MPTRRTIHRKIDVLSPEDVRALMDACSRRAPTGIRHRALNALLYGTGLRISKALALRPKDVDLDGLTVTVHNGKGDKRGVSALLPDAVDSIQRWVGRRATYGVTAREPFLCTIGRGAVGPMPTAPGGRLGREFMARVRKRLARRAGLAKHVHPRQAPRRARGPRRSPISHPAWIEVRQPVRGEGEMRMQHRVARSVPNAGPT